MTISTQNFSPLSPHSTSCHLLKARITSPSSHTHPPTVMGALEARWLPTCVIILHNESNLNHWLQQGVNLHIFNFSHKYWTSRSWGTFNHWFLTWIRRVTQTEEIIYVSGARHWGPGASLQPWLCVSKGRSLSACQPQIQCQVSYIDCFSHPLMSP